MHAEQRARVSHVLRQSFDRERRSICRYYPGLSGGNSSQYRWLYGPVFGHGLDDQVGVVTNLLHTLANVDAVHRL